MRFSLAQSIKNKKKKTGEETREKRKRIEKAYRNYDIGRYRRDQRDDLTRRWELSVNVVSDPEGEPTKSPVMRKWRRKKRTFEKI